MKKYLGFLIFLVPLISYSCNDSFNPKEVFKQQYVLNCIIWADSNIQIAHLSHTYDVPGFDPSVNTTDPSITGAKIFIKWNGQNYQLRDSSIARIDTFRYKGPLKFYYTKEIKPTGSDLIQITAIPVDGISLTSTTRVPSGVYFMTVPYSLTGEEAQLNIQWLERDSGDFFLPRLRINYIKRNETPSVIHSLEIPITYITSGGITQPGYPGISTSTSLIYDRTIIDDYMIKISVGDNKDNYKFIGLNMELLIFDPSLAGYISSTNGFLDNLSIRLDEPNYSNVNGGLGIFGAFCYSQTTVGLTSDYLELLGYTP